MAIITISRGTKSGGKKLAEMLSEKLDYRCISREIIVQASEKYGIPEYKLFTAIQKSPTLLQRFTFDRDRYLAYITESLCEAVKDDNVVYHGHAGHFLLQGISHVMKVRIVANMKFRAEAAMEQMNLSYKEAERYIEEVDKQRVRWSKFLYGIDWCEPGLYDIVFNVDRTDLEFVCSIIEHAVKQPVFQSTDASQKAMQDLVLISHIRAALAGLPKVRLEQLRVRADRGEITIEGKVKSEDLLQSISETVMKVPGVKQVIQNCQFDFRYQGIDT